MKVKVLYICSFTCVASNRKEHMHVYCFNANHTFVVASPSPCNPSRVHAIRNTLPAQTRSSSLLQRIIRCTTPSPWISPSDTGASSLNTARRFTKYAITCNHCLQTKYHCVLIIRTLLNPCQWVPNVIRRLARDSSEMPPPSFGSTICTIQQIDEGWHRLNCASMDLGFGMKYVCH